MKWAYKVICLTDDDVGPKELNLWGEDGWELVSATRDKEGIWTLIFKRPINPYQPLE